MTNLKDKINKAATFRELKQIAENRYEQSWQPELQKDAFIDGAEALLKLLRIGVVSQRYTIEDIERCVENWGLCKVEKEYIERFLNGG
jgi:hypothetical protein